MTEQTNDITATEIARIQNVFELNISGEKLLVVPNDRLFEFSRAGWRQIGFFGFHGKCWHVMEERK